LEISGIPKGECNFCHGSCQVGFYNIRLNSTGRWWLGNLKRLVENPIDLDHFCGCGVGRGFCKPLLLKSFQLGFRSLPLGKAALLSA